MTSTRSHTQAEPLSDAATRVGLSRSGSRANQSLGASDSEFKTARLHTTSESHPTTRSQIMPLVHDSSDAFFCLDHQYAFMHFMRLIMMLRVWHNIAMMQCH